MFTDMVGYSALTQKNEALALDLLEEHRKILRPIFEKHDGREIETAGDSFFVEFKSAVESANCAIEIQQTLNERNKTELPERQIRLRIGLHIGDVVYVDKQVHGDGVNIAARMEPLAQPGGICISEDVARQIRNKVPYPVVKLGEEKLKNISMPMDIYCIVLPWLHNNHPRPKKGFSAKKIKLLVFGLLSITLIATAIFFVKNFKSEKQAHSKNRLAVLPLSNISNDAKDEYFADGMTEELISSLSKISGLNVIARTSIMKYKSTDLDISKIGSELMVGSILEGSVRKFENKARVTVQLIDVLTQEHLWSRDYDRELKDIFMIQSEIAQNVANELKVRLVSSEKEQLEKGTTEDMLAFEEYLVGKHYLNQRTSESIQNSVIHFEKSIQRDSLFALPYASLAYAYTLIGVAGYGNFQRSVAETKAKVAVMKALEIDETLAEAHAALGYIKFRIDWDWKAAEKELKRAIALKPSNATAHEWYALFLAIHVRLDEALTEMQTAYQLDPLSPSVNTGLARIYHFRNEHEKGLAQIQKALKLDPNYAEAYFTAGMTHFKISEYDNAVTELEKAVELSGSRPVMMGVLGALYEKMGRKAEAKKILDELQSEPVTNDKLYAVSFIKFNAGHKGEAFDILEKLLADKYGILIYMKVESGFFGGSDDTRYHQMLARMGLE
jgi:TolB-like protein/class 3 adenylate cyclase/Flp pilus assembly protein TadD